MSPAPRFDLIITNPPYRYTKEFVERALQWRRREKSMVAMMLRVNLIGSQTRAGVHGTIGACPKKFRVIEILNGVIHYRLNHRRKKQQPVSWRSRAHV